MRNYIILYRDDQEEVAGAGDGVIDTYIILHILTQDNPTNLAHERWGEQRADSVFQVSLGWALESQACLGVSGPRACMLRGCLSPSPKASPPKPLMKISWNISKHV